MTRLTQGPVSAAAALQAALAAEDAAIFGYGVAGAHLTGQQPGAAEQDWTGHNEARDTLAAMISALGAAPVAAQAFYQLPFRVHDAASAMALAAYLEDGVTGRTSASWRSATRRACASSARWPCRARRGAPPSGAAAPRRFPACRPPSTRPRHGAPLGRACLVPRPGLAAAVLSTGDRRPGFAAAVLSAGDG